MLISKEFQHIPKDSLFSVPLGLEYEKLYRWLNQRRAQKYHIQDETFGTKDESKIISPGTANTITNQSDINFEEPNTKLVYPQSTIPYSQGVIWE